MPIRHIAMFEIADGTTNEEYSAIASKAEQLIRSIPGVQAYEGGLNSNPEAEVRTAGVTMLFDDFDAFIAHTQHPNHQKVVEMVSEHWKDAWMMQLEI